MYRLAETETADVERLSSVLEKIQAWIEQVSEQQLHNQVPFQNAALMIYWQLMAQHQKRRISAILDEATETSEVSVEDAVDFNHLQDMLDLATWAYYLADEEDLRTKLATHKYDLKTGYIPHRPGSVGYFVAEKHDYSASEGMRSTLLIGVRGTSSLEELLTDACGRSVSYFGLEYGEEDQSNSIRIEVAAQELDRVCCASERNASNGECQVEIVSGHERIWVEQDSDDHNDRVHDIDHTLVRKHLFRRRSSVDSHIRCHEGILLSAKRLFAQVRAVIEERVVRGNHRLLLVGHSLGGSAACLLALILRSRYPVFVNSDRLHVYAFAPPPVLDHDTAIGASPYVTSVVYGTDLIARCSLANLAVFLEMLSTISSEILVAKGLAPIGAYSTAALLGRLSQGDNGEPFWSEDELALAVANAQAKVELRDPDHLYVPGKLYFLEARAGAFSDEEHPDKIVGRAYSCTVTDGTAPSLRVVEMNGYCMLGDHTTASYHAAVGALASAQQSRSKLKILKHIQVA